MKKPIFTDVQKKLPLKDYQIDILESMEKIKSCDIIISIKKDRTPGPHTIHMHYNGKKLTDSSLKK